MFSNLPVTRTRREKANLRFAQTLNSVLKRLILFLYSLKFDHLNTPIVAITWQIFHTVCLINAPSYLDINEMLRFFNSLNIRLVNGAFGGDTAGPCRQRTENLT